MADTLNQPGAGSHDQMLTGSTRLGRVHLAGLEEDPADAENGDIWYRSDTKKYRTQTPDGVGTITVVLDM